MMTTKIVDIVYQELSIELQLIIQIEQLDHGLKGEIQIFQMVQKSLILKQFMENFIEVKIDVFDGILDKVHYFVFVLSVVSVFLSSLSRIEIV